MFSIFFLIGSVLPLNSGDNSNSMSNYDFLDLPKGVNQPGQFNWDDEKKQLTFLKTLAFSDQKTADDDLDGFYWKIPTLVKEVIITEDVTITGGFRVNGQTLIRGENRETSRVYGTKTPKWAAGKNGTNESRCNDTKGDDRANDCEKWSFGAISPMKYGAKYELRVESLTIENARTYAITFPKGKLMVDDVVILNTRGKDYQSNSDGIAGGPGTVIQNTWIDTWDDAIKLYENTTVKNVTIVHNANGAPFQFGWSSKEKTEHVIENVKIVLPDNPSRRANLSVFSASLKNGSVDATVHIKGKGLYADYSKNRELQLRTNEPMPWAWIKSEEAVIEVIVAKDATAFIDTPGGIKGPGKVNISGPCKKQKRGDLKCGGRAIALGAPYTN